MKKPKPSRWKNGDRHLSSADLCQRFGISRYTLHRWRKDEALSFPQPFFINSVQHYLEAKVIAWELKQAGLQVEDPSGLPSTIDGLAVVSGVISEYDDFVQAMVSQRAAMNMTSIELDAKSGMQEGYMSKLENWGRPYGRGMGPETFPLWLGALRVGIVLVALPRRPRSFTKHAAAARMLDAEVSA